MKYTYLLCVAFLAFFIPLLHGQKVISIVQYDSSAIPLDKYEIIYVCQDDSLIQTIQGLKVLGKIIIRVYRKEEYGLYLLAIELKQRARALGANLLKIDANQNSKRYDILNVTLYYSPGNILENKLSHFGDKQLMLINPTFNMSRVVLLDDSAITLPPRTYFRYLAEKDTQIIKVNSGLLEATWEVNSKNLTRRFFLISRFNLKPYEKNTSKVPLFDDYSTLINRLDIVELDEFTGSIYLAVYSEYKNSRSFNE